MQFQAIVEITAVRIRSKPNTSVLSGRPSVAPEHGQVAHVVRCHALVPQVKKVVEVFQTVFDIPSVHALVAIPKCWFKAITIWCVERLPLSIVRSVYVNSRLACLAICPAACSDATLGLTPSLIGTLSMQFPASVEITTVQTRS